MQSIFKKIRGFTLLEMLVVLIIISSVIVMLVGYMSRRGEDARRDKTVLEMQQILNAGLAFYVDKGRWPNCSDSNCFVNNPSAPSELVSGGYLPDVSYSSFWGGQALQMSPPTDKNFAVCVTVAPSASNAATAASIAGRLPLGQTSPSTGPCGATLTFKDCTDPTKACKAYAAVNVPGQNLNNARSVNFSGVYHNGACVPVPTCLDGTSSAMVPQIYVIPVSVSGLYTGNTGELYPISSFTAYIRGPKNWTGTAGTAPDNCTNDPSGSSPVCIQDSTGNKLPSGNYWRVCLDIVTQAGRIQGLNWVAASGAIAAITRCAPPNEPAGSTFDVFQPF